MSSGSPRFGGRVRLKVTAYAGRDDDFAIPALRIFEALGSRGSRERTPGESGATTVYSNPETVVVAPPTAASGLAPKL
jgi:hypothetical protein